MMETFFAASEMIFSMAFDYFENNYNMIQKSEENKNA